MNDASPPAALLLAGIVSMALSVAEGDALVAATALAAAIAAMCLIVQSRSMAVPRIPCLLAALTCIAGTCTLLFAFEWRNGGDMGLEYAEGVMVWISVFPTAFLAVSAVANASGAVFNRVAASAFTAFASIGIVALALTAVSVLFADELDVKYRFAQEMVYLFVDIVLSTAAAIAMAVMLKGRHYRMRRREAGE